MAIDERLIEQLLADYKKPEDIIGENGLLRARPAAAPARPSLPRALGAELTQHLGYEKHDPAGHHRGNTRNGKSHKTLKGDFGELELETPRDRKATFDPKIVAKGQTRWTGFDDKMISMYARGTTTREIQGHLEEMYGIEVSLTLISNVTDAVIALSRVPDLVDADQEHAVRNFAVGWDHRGEALVVVANRVVGIFTERDVLKKLALSGRDPEKVHYIDIRRLDLFIHVRDCSPLDNIVALSENMPDG